MFLKNSPITKNFVLSILLFFVVCFFLYLCRAVLLPFIIAALFAYLMSPILNKMMFFGLKRWVAVVILTIGLIALLVIVFIKFVPIIYNDINVLINNFSVYTEYVKNLTLIIQQKIAIYVPINSQNEIFTQLTGKTSDLTSGAIKEISYLLKKLFSVFYIIIFLPVLTFFMLLEYHKFKKIIIDIVPAKYVEPIISIYYEASSVLSRYIRGQIIEVIFVAGATIIGLSILGINYAFLIGIIAGVCNLIPYLGPLVGLIMGVIVTAVQFHSFGMVFEVMVLFFIIQQIDNNIIQPVVVGRNVQLSPVSIVFALLAGTEIFGIMGMLFAVPILALTKNVFLIFIKRYKRAGNHGKSC